MANTDLNFHMQLPFGAWPTDHKLRSIGEKILISTNISLPATASLLQTVMSPEDADLLIAGVKKTLSDKSVHAYCHYYAWWGQKPLE
jgi:hypothetical protein